MNSKGVLTFNLGGVDFDFVPHLRTLTVLNQLKQADLWHSKSTKTADAIKCF